MRDERQQPDLRASARELWRDLVPGLRFVLLQVQHEIASAPLDARHNTLARAAHRLGRYRYFALCGIPDSLARYVLLAAAREAGLENVGVIETGLRDGSNAPFGNWVRYHGGMA